MVWYGWLLYSGAGLLDLEQRLVGVLDEVLRDQQQPPHRHVPNPQRLSHGTGAQGRSLGRSRTVVRVSVVLRYCGTAGCRHTAAQRTAQLPPVQDATDAKGRSMQRWNRRGTKQHIRRPNQRAGRGSAPVGRGGLHRPVGRGGLHRPVGRGGLRRPVGRGGLHRPVGRGGLRRPVGRGGLTLPRRRAD
jgi:hypothetical protein